MILKTSKILYSRATLVPWNAMDTEPVEIPERGLHWGMRECNFIVSGGKTPNPVLASIKLLVKLKGTK